MDSTFRKTAAQQQALKLLGGGSRYVLLFGGSRSGKTFILVYALLVPGAACSGKPSRDPAAAREQRAGSRC